MPRHNPARRLHRPLRGPDPWARAGVTADNYAPRLVAAASARRARHGLVVDLTAALWGGDEARSLTLTPYEAYDLGVQLVQLALPGLPSDRQAAGLRAVLQRPDVAGGAPAPADAAAA